jgi:hypothetical protein
MAGTSPAMTPVGTCDINAVAGGIQARRIVDRLYAEEQAVANADRTAAE